MVASFQDCIEVMGGDLQQVTAWAAAFCQAEKWVSLQVVPCFMSLLVSRVVKKTTRSEWGRWRDRDNANTERNEQKGWTTTSLCVNESQGGMGRRQKRLEVQMAYFMPNTSS